VADDDQLTADERQRFRDERRDRFRAAAYEAERNTGRRERTDEEAQRNIIVRIGIIILGTLVTLAGLAMMVLPGPGIVVIIAGLGILASEVSWAERLLAYAKRKSNVEGITAQHPWIKPVSIVLMVLGVAASILYTVRWR
jgi:uncharacterized protein (TIGR02611 family)